MNINTDRQNVQYNNKNLYNDLGNKTFNEIYELN